MVTIQHSADISPYAKAVSRILLVVALATCLHGPARAQSVSSVGSLVLSGVTVLNVDGTPPRIDVDVIIEKDRIVAIGPVGRQRPRNATIARLAGAFIIPGLWDMHVHMSRYAAPLLVANGVTSVRDMGGNLVAIDWMRRAIESDALTGPTIYRVGPFVDGGKPGLPDRILVSSASEGKAVADFLASLHVDAIKVHSGVPRDAYFSLLAEAKRLHLPVVGHAPVALTAEEISNAGQRSIEYMSSIAGGRLNALMSGGMNGKDAFDTVERELPSLSKLFVRNGTWIDPTFVAERVSTNRAAFAAANDPRRNAVPLSTRQSWDRTWPLETESPASLARKQNYLTTQMRWATSMRASGVKFLAGTDLGVRDIYPGSSVHDELELMVQAGFTPAQALETATRNPAIVMERDKIQGSVRAGMLADLVVLDGNPLEDIANVRRIRAVILRGRMFDRTQLDALIAEAARAAAIP